MSRFGRSFVVAASEFLLVVMTAVMSATPGTGVSGSILAKGTSPFVATLVTACVPAAAENIKA